MSLKKIWATLFAAAAIAACGSMKNKETTQQSSEQVVHTLLTQERQKAILEELKAKAIYDETTEVSYVFETMPTDEDTIGIAARNNIFFATPWVVNVMMSDADTKNLDVAWYTYKKVAEDVYQVQVQGDMQNAQQKLLAQPWVQAAVYEYMAYNAGCVSYNDPQFTGYGQAHISADPWIAAWYPNTPTQAVDSVDVYKPMHTPSTAASPNVVGTVIDWGINITNTDVNWNIVYAYDYINNTTGNDITSSNHASRVTMLIWAKANNSYGSVWVAHDFPMFSLDWWNDAWVSNTAAYAAYDYIYNQALANPTQKQVVNMSYSSWNDPITHAKIQQSYNLQANKQVFFVSAGWNTGAAVISYPAARPEVIGVWAVNAEDPNKARWSWSNTGAELDFVADGQNVRVMEANGTFSNKTGTSYAAPIVAWAVLHLISQDPLADFATVYNRLKESAKDLGTTWFDNLYGHWYARTASALKYAVIEDMPTAINAWWNANYTFTFTPKFYNTTSSFTPMQTLNRKMYYPNNTLVPSVTNPDGTVSFNPVFNTNNGFSATNPAVNRLRYEFTPSNAPSCVTTIKTKPITITNLSTLGTQEVDLLKGHFYPNPVQDKLTITNVSELGLDDAKVTIGDVSGRTVFMTTLNPIGDDNATIDMSQFSAGTYFVQFHPKDSAIRPRPIKIIKK